MAAKQCIIKMHKSGIIRAAVICALLLLLLLHFLPERKEAQEGLQKAAEGLVQYQAVLRLDDQEHTLAISQRVDYVNHTGDTLSTLVLRTWLNAFETEETSPAALSEIYDACYPGGFSPGRLSLYDVIWNGERAEHRYLDAQKTALEIAIPPLAPMERGILEIRLVAHLPACAYRVGYTEKGYQLGNVLPLLSVYENGSWRQDPYSPVGDPFLSECANFSLTLHIPQGYTPACSAPLERDQDGVWRGEILAARDVGLCVMRDYEMVKGRQGGTEVYAYAPTREGAKRALEYARRALETFSSLYGAYPYPAYTVCSAQFPFGGMEYPALCMVEEGYYLESRKDTLELVIAHETAHQWFYGLVGSDQVKNPWQDEALSEYAMLRYVQKRYGRGSFESLKYYRVDAPMQEMIPGSLTPGTPIDYFSSFADYASVVYGRGAADTKGSLCAILFGMEEMLREGITPPVNVYIVSSHNE